MSKSKIPAKVLAGLNRQVNHELSAAHGYRALALWCAHQNLKGFAAFFAKQADEESEHAGKIADHLIARGALPELTALPTPRQDFKSLLDVARQARAMEEANTQSIHGLYEGALAARDYPAQVLLQWFINEQVEEEAWAQELVARVEAATCAGSLLDLDRHIEKLLDAPNRG